MATNLSIDPALIEKALEVSGERTKKAAVTKALQEFIAGMRLGERGLALDQQAPHGLVFVRVVGGLLRHRPVGGHAGIVAAEVLEGREVHRPNMGTQRLANPGEVGRLQGRN